MLKTHGQCCKKHNIYTKIGLGLIAVLFAFSPMSAFAATTTYSGSLGTASETYQISTNHENGVEQYVCSGKDIIDTDLSIYDIEFHNHSAENDTTQAIGITGTVENKTNFDIYFTLNINYYSTSGSRILQTNNMHLAPASKTVKFVDMEDAGDFKVYNRSTGETAISVPTSFNIGLGLKSDTYGEEQGAFASESYTYADYVYDSYDVKVIVGEDESLKIVEKADAFFNTSKQGIIRHLPTRWDTDTIQGSRRTSIEDISVNKTFITSKDYLNKQLDIRIGDEGTYIKGLQHYEIAYTYKIDKENETAFDEFYYNLIDDSQNISNATFSITMSKAFDISRIGFSSGRYGSKENNIIYYVEDNTITGLYTGILRNGAITARIALDDGYYNNLGLPIPEAGEWIKIAIYAPFAMLLIVFAMWYMFGRDEKHISAVEFYPPDGMNSLDMQLYYRGEADSDGVVSLLTYLASKGYLTIEQQGRKYTLHKVKEYDGNNEDERLFMTRLFSGNRTEVTSTALKNRFYRTVNTIIKDTNNKTNKNIIFEKRPGIITFICVLCAIATVALPVIAFAVDTESYDMLGLLLMLGFLMAFYIPFFVAGINVGSIGAKIIVLGFTGIHFTLMIGGIVSSTGIFDMLDELNPLYLYTLIALVCCLILEVVLISHLPKRTQHGAQMLARIEGFRNFLMTAERSRLEMLVSQDPNYFYSIIPYAYVLGVSKKWMRQFEDIAIATPSWYVSDEPFSYSNFRHFMDHTVSGVSRSMTSSPSSSGSSGGGSSGGSSGGGSSGGGGGGGGSSSW